MCDFEKEEVDVLSINILFKFNYFRSLSQEIVKVQSFKQRAAKILKTLIIK